MAEEQETEWALVTETRKGRKRTANNYEQLTSLDCFYEGYNCFNETNNNNKLKAGDYVSLLEKSPLLQLYRLMHTHE